MFRQTKYTFYFVETKPIFFIDIQVFTIYKHNTYLRQYTILPSKYTVLTIEHNTT